MSKPIEIDMDTLKPIAEKIRSCKTSQEAGEIIVKNGITEISEKNLILCMALGRHSYFGRTTFGKEEARYKYICRVFDSKVVK